MAQQTHDVDYARWKPTYDLAAVAEDAPEELRELFTTCWSNGHEVEYRGLTLQKVDWPHPEHSEYAILNDDGSKVSSFTIGAFQANTPHDTVEEGVGRLIIALDRIADEMPANISEWSDRARERRSERPDGLVTVLPDDTPVYRGDVYAFTSHPEIPNIPDGHTAEFEVEARMRSGYAVRFVCANNDQIRRVELCEDLAEWLDAGDVRLVERSEFRPGE
jgi:hypothetical protein